MLWTTLHLQFNNKKGASTKTRDIVYVEVSHGFENQAKVTLPQKTTRTKNANDLALLQKWDSQTSYLYFSFHFKSAPVAGENPHLGIIFDSVNVFRREPPVNYCYDTSISILWLFFFKVRWPAPEINAL